MIVRIGEFIKKNGEKRVMRFLKISDMGEEEKRAVGLMENREYKHKTLAPGSEMVYDIDSEDFRVFNWSTVVGEVKQEEIEYKLGEEHVNI